MATSSNNGVTESFRSFFTPTIFTRRNPLANSPFIRAMHPKTEIRPDAASIERVLSAGWVGQLKIHGHRAQIHIPADRDKSPIAYTRQGKRHALALSYEITAELFRLFRPKKGWNAIDAEWLKPEAKLFVFDFLKKEDVLQSLKTYPDRWALLPRNFISPHLSILPVLRDLPACLKALKSTKEEVEGLVFKSSNSIGFSDTSIVRCRKR